MFIHSVYFTLRPDLTPAEHERFLAGARSLLTIGTVVDGHLGRPAATDRPVIDRAYSYALVVTFTDQAAHDAYQVDPVHDTFRDECATLWSEVRIFDVDTAATT
ncbi:Dabb family protein [Dactylosporangium sp. NPDC005555]|uniref:Dabb family protein n=1 Tax=Dactylosporangium sp. NPDC005555 TaxID=3154889 RepID=UPI0033BF6A92